MKAVVYRKYGPPDVLSIEDVEKPVPKNNEIVVKVSASTVNRTDCAQLRAKPFIMRFVTGLFKPKRQILGTTFAGEITTIGSSVKDYKIGDRVFGFNDDGLSSYAEYIAIATNKAIAKTPDKISDAQAAACSEGAHYAINFINKVEINHGTRVLLNGGTGAIGSAAIQLLKNDGAIVTATCGTKHLALIKSLGANDVIDYQTEDFTKINETFDFVCDAVGKSTFSKCKHLLKPKGIYISSELGPMAQNIFYALFTPLFFKKKVIFPIPTDINGSIKKIKLLLKQDEYQPLIDKTYSIEEISEAFKYVETGEKIGNVVITIS